MDIKGLFADISKQMEGDFAKTKKSLSHSGLKGDANEEVVREFLRQYLPKTLDVTSGCLIDSDGGQSKQLDVILSDSAKTPILYESGETRVIPVECAYAVIEVKAYLDKKELEIAYQNMQSVKSLVKRAYFKDRGGLHYIHNLYGREWDYWPVNYFIFAYDSEGIDSVCSNMISLQTSDQVHKRIDTICILTKGVILNQVTNGKFCALPAPDSKVVASHTEDALLLFYALTSIILNQVGMSPFNLMPYLKNMSF